MKLSHLLVWSISSSIWLGSLCAFADAASAHADAVSSRTVKTCGFCHGTNGRSVSPMFPHLAGQPAAYIEAQLKAFKDQTRADPDAKAYMWGMAAPLSEPMIRELAEYFSKQPAAAGKSGDPSWIQRGKVLFEDGVPERQIPACASCHGARAEGTAAVPRLAGQHSPYLLKQLKVIQRSLRDAPVMQSVVKNLTPQEMQAVAAYLESI